MRQASILFTVLGAVGLAGLLSACGSGSPSASASAGGASGSGSASASGTVTGFGSIFVNGKKFETENVEVRIGDDNPKHCQVNVSSTCGLKKGMTVTVNGSFSGNRHTANTVRQKDAVEGLVESVAADQLVVMGQTVLVDSTTIFDNNFSPAAGDFVEVNGLIQPNGIIQATFIEKKLANVTPEVRGYVSSHVAGSSTFRIGSLIVDYVGAIIADMPPPNGNNWDGLFVEVKGANASAFNSTTTTLTASKVELEQKGFGDDVDEFEVEGFVTDIISVDLNTRVARFFIGTTEVRTTGGTEFREGTIDEVVIGAKVSAEGRLENGVLIATHVKFKESARLEGDIAAVTGTTPTQTLTIKGLPGVIVMTNDQTRIDNGPLQANLHVRVRGRLSGANIIIATRIKVESSSKDDVILQGQVQAAADPSLTILGVVVITTGVQFQGHDDGLISRAAFFTALTVNETLVKVKGKWNGTTVIWDEAELED